METSPTDARDIPDARGWEPVARLEDVPDGGLLAVALSTGEKVCLANVNGAIHAVSDTCTHQEFPMSQGTILPNGTIECAWHGARFDCRTGAVRHPPAEEPLPVYGVRVEGGVILVGGRKP